ncbi:glycosyltransferase [Candidatus Neomarinimicrobiota bacterium]
MDLSIVIPAFNERTKIATDVAAAGEFLQQEGLNGEIIVVDDGSSDDTAGNARNVILPARQTLKVIRYNTNRGKGAAVRTGIIETTGEYIMFVDSGLCIPYDQTKRGLSLLREDRCELAHASRRLPESVIVRPQVWYRRLLSRLFYRTIRLWMRVPRTLTDTQCGFKIYKGEVGRTLYSLCKTDGFMFDIELILLAQRGGFRISEFPVDWTSDPDSRLSLTRTPIRVLRELRSIRTHLKQAGR